jgi:hypothetical protein
MTWRLTSIRLYLDVLLVDHPPRLLLLDDRGHWRTQ